MARFARKVLVVDPDKLRTLARRRGMSESAAVREAIDRALLGDTADVRLDPPTSGVRETIDFPLLATELEEALLELSALGGIDDVFGKMPSEIESENRPQTFATEIPLNAQIAQEDL